MGCFDPSLARRFGAVWRRRSRRRRPEVGVDGTFGAEPRALLRVDDAPGDPEAALRSWSRLSQRFGFGDPYKFVSFGALLTGCWATMPASTTAFLRRKECGGVRACQVRCIFEIHIQITSLTREKFFVRWRSSLELLQRLVMQLGSWETAPTVRPDEPHDLPGGTPLSSDLFSFCLSFWFTKGHTASLAFTTDLFVCLFTEGWF